MSKGVLLPPVFGYRVANSTFTGPGAGYKLRVRDGGTANLSTVYTDVDLTTAGTNPVVANSNGEWADDGATQGGIYVDDGTYDVALLTDADVELAEITDVRARILFKEIGWNITGAPAGSAILTWEVVLPFTVLENMSGSVAHVNTAVTADYTISFKKNGAAAFNSITISAAGTDGAVASTNSETSFVAGDTLTATLPAADATAADLAIGVKVRVD